MKRPGVWITVALISGVVLGGAASSGDSRPEFVEITRTKIVKEPAPPPVEVEVFPEACQRAVDLAADMARSAEGIYASGEEQLDIYSDTRLAAAAGASTLEIETRQRRLHGKTVGDLFDLEQAFAAYDTATKECEKDND